MKTGGFRKGIQGEMKNHLYGAMFEDSKYNEKFINNLSLIPFFTLFQKINNR